MSDKDAVEIDRCGCGEPATHEVQPPASDRDDFISVCESCVEDLRPISAEVRKLAE